MQLTWPEQEPWRLFDTPTLLEAVVKKLGKLPRERVIADLFAICYGSSWLLNRLHAEYKFTLEDFKDINLTATGPGREAEMWIMLNLGSAKFNINKIPVTDGLDATVVMGMLSHALNEIRLCEEQGCGPADDSRQRVSEVLEKCGEVPKLQRTSLIRHLWGQGNHLGLEILLNHPAYKYAFDEAF